MKISARGFLRFVGFEYVAVGLAGLAAVHSGSFWFMVGCGEAALFLLVVPELSVMEYGIQASCFGQPSGSWGCNLEPAEIQHAQLAITALCVASILGGLAGIWAASTKDKEAGRAVWLVLVAISVAVGLWDLRLVFAGAYFLGCWRSALWAGAYVTAYSRWFGKERVSAAPTSE